VVHTENPNGEVAWQRKEQGDLYGAPYFHGDRLVSVRKLPFNVTTRYRATGRLLGRLDLPALSEEDGHPLLENGPRELPMDHDGRQLVVTDSWYYLFLDVETMQVKWKRKIDSNDPTREPKLRFELGGDYLAVLKEDFDVKAIYMLSSRNGNVLWRTDPQQGSRPRPIHAMLLAPAGPAATDPGGGADTGARLYGIRPHPGQGFYLVCMDAATGKDLFAPHEEKGYNARPEVSLEKRLFGSSLVARVKDRQDFELVVFRADNGSRTHKTKGKGTGDFGAAGRVSAAVQNGSLALFGDNKLHIAAGKR
jgi:hypothetical protein